MPREASIFMIDGRKLKVPKSKASAPIQSKYGRAANMGQVEKVING